MPTEAEVRRVMLAADASGDGQLDFLEFLSLVKSLKDERRGHSNFVSSVASMLDTIKSDVLGGIFKGDLI